MPALTSKPNHPILPMRKIWHMGGGFLICGLYFWVINSNTLGLIMLAAVGLVFISVDMWRLFHQKFNDQFFEKTSFMYLRDRDYFFNSSTVFIIGSWFTILFYDKLIAIAAILFLSVGDVIAEVIGVKYGRIKVGTRTMEGSLAFLISCLAFGIPLFGLKMAFIGSLAAVISELVSIKLDDNILIPILSGLAMTLLL
jgi:diacylglycerol kinase (CTP)